MLSSRKLELSSVIYRKGKEMYEKVEREKSNKSERLLEY